MRVPGLTLALLFLSACNGTDALVKRCLEAHGGLEAIRAADKLVERGSVTSLLHPGGKGEIARAFQRPDKLRVETHYPDGAGEIRILDGQRGWRDQQPAEGPRLDSMILQAARLDVAARLAEGGAAVTERTEWTLDGRTLRVLVLPVKAGMDLEVGVDPSTGRVRRTRTVAAEAGKPIEFITSYSDYRPIAGVLVAFHEENWANGSTTGETTLESVEAPKVMPELMFQP